MKTLAHCVFTRNITIIKNKKVSGYFKKNKVGKDILHRGTAAYSPIPPQKEKA